jgi:hypothetical protein
VEFGAPHRLYGDDAGKLDRWGDLAARHGLRLVRSPVRHMGTENAAAVLTAMRAHLEGKVEVRTDTEAVELLTEPDLTAPDTAGPGAWTGQPEAGTAKAGATGARAAGARGARVTGVRTAAGDIYRAAAVIARRAAGVGVASPGSGAAWYPLGEHSV